MATTTVSVSFSNGFLGNATGQNESSASTYLTALGWSNFQFQQATDNGRFGGTQGNDLSGTILITDALGVQHAIDGVINWRAPSGSVSTIVFYATGTTNHTLAVSGGGTRTIDPNTEVNGDPHNYIGLTFNGQTLAINGGKVNGNAATSGLLTALNTYLDNQPQLSVSDVTVNEGAGTATVTVSLNKTTTDTVTVKYATQNGTASAGADYTASGGMLSFAPNETSKTITVPLVDNASVDGVRSLNVILSDSRLAAIVDNTGVVTINDNDGAPVTPPAAPTVTAVKAEDAAHTGATPADSEAIEGGSLVYTVTLSGSAGGEFALALSGSTTDTDRGAIAFSNGVAWKNGSAASGTIVVPAGVGSFRVTLPSVDDALIESTETAVLTVGGMSATGSIADNDSQSVSTVVALDSSVTEGAALRYAVTLNAASPAPTEYAVSFGGTAAGADRGALAFSDGVTWKNGDANTGIIVVPAGLTSFQATLATIDDTLIEHPETVDLTVGGVSATGGIADNDVQSVSTVVALDSSITEGAALRYAVTLNAASPAPTEYALAFGGTAASADRGALAFSDGVAWKNGDANTGIIVVPAGLTSFQATLATIDDTLIEQLETVDLTVGGVTATGSILDNDGQAVAGVLAEDAAHAGANPVDSAVVEGAALLYTVALSAAGPYPVEHLLAVSGTADAADLGSFVFSDGVAWKNHNPQSGIVVVPAHVAGFTVTVPTVDDSLIESAESLVLTVGGIAATGTISDNDSQAVTSVLVEDAAHSGAAPVDASVVEGASLLVTVALSTVSPNPTEHSFTVSGNAGAADLGSFVFSDGVTWKNNSPQGGIVVVPAHVAGFTVSVPTIDDSLIESAESLVLSVGGIAATGTISDNDSQAVTSVLAEDAARTGASPVDSTVEEGAALLYTVALNAASPVAVEHALAVSGTASGADRGSFVFSNGVSWKNNDPQSGIVVVPANVASFTVGVATIDDGTVESAESLVLTIGGVAATGTIADNDRVSIASVLAEDAAQAGALPVDNAVIEGGTLQYTVALSARAVTAEEFLLGLGGTASGLDHGALSFSAGASWKNNDPATGIVVVAAGVESFRISVATNDDLTVELAESLAITVGGVTGTGTITDNDAVSVASVIAEDAAQVGLNPVDSTVGEGGILRYTVHLSSAGVVPGEFQLAFGGSAGAADIAGIVFSDGVAWKNDDAATGIIIVPAGIGSFKITVGTSDDSLIELSESLVATVGGVTATGTIVDNDSQSVTSLKAEDAANPGALPVDSSVEEGAALVFTATLNGPSPTATEYALALGGSASAADLGAISFGQGVRWKNDDPASGSIVVAAGVSSFTVTLRTNDDSLVEATESALLSIGGTGATGTIADNDSLAITSVLAEDAANMGQNPQDSIVTEGGTLRYTVTLNAVAPRPTEFALALGGTASSSDIGALAFSDGVSWKNNDPASGIVVIPAGVVSFSVTLPTVDDDSVESSESAVLVVNGVRATGTLFDNDYVPPPPEPVPPPVVPVDPVPPVIPPVVPPAPVLETGLDPASDDGASNQDTVTSVRTPEFTLQGSQLAAGGSVRLLSPEGLVVGTSAITEADALAGKVNVGPGPLDDGVYTYTAQVMDASGKVVASAPVTVTVVTDLDGVMPSIELAAHGGDFNHDGILDWNQHSVAHMPLRSLADFTLGKNAPVAAFGAIMAGSLGTEAGDVQLTQGAQLKELSLTDLPAVLPQEFRAASPVFNFTIGAEADVPTLPDLDPSRAGLQTRVVIDLGANGAVSNDFMKFDRASQSWYSFLDDQNLATFDDGATLVDLNNDGRIDRIVLTLTDGAKGDDDGVADGKIVDPGLLAFDTTPPNQVYSIRLNSGETYYTADIGDAQVKSNGTGNVFLGVAFDSLTGAPDAKHVSAFYQPFTNDMSFAIDGQDLPYACYEVMAGSSGFFAAAAGKAAVDIHLYQNVLGLTELVSQAQARELGLAAQGYADRGAQFSVNMDNAFKFDAEGYLIANQENTAIQALVKQLAGMYASTSAAGFIEAVEQNYFEQIKLVGVAHGASASAADLNAVFGTGFGS